jgi:acetoin utilization deacetylase AcuC-like enzyme
LDSQADFFPSLIRGSDKGGSSVNIPWPTKGMGDAEYLWAFEKIVMPISTEFSPDLVISKLYPRVYDFFRRH